MNGAELVREIHTVRRARLERIRRLVLEDRRVDVLATEVLGYQVRPFHREILEHQEASRENLTLAPRGFGKSTVGTVARCIFEVLVDPNVRILICSNTALQAEVFLREIKHHLAANPLLVEIFGEQRGAKWDTTEIEVRGKTAPWKEATVTTLGVGGPVASRHYELIIGDDLVAEKNARTELQREQVRTWYYKVLYPTVVDETSRVFLIGTRFHPQDLWGTLQRNDPDVSVKVIRALDADGSTPWPEKFSVAHLHALRTKMGPAIFNSQYQNDTDAMKGQIFKEEWFRFYDAAPRSLDPDDRPRVVDGRELGPWESFSGWIGCDPAATKKDIVLTARKADTDYWTIAVAYREIDAGGEWGSRLYFRYLWRARCSKDQYVRKLQQVYDEMVPQVEVAGVEDVAAQEYLVQDVMKAGLAVRRIGRSTDKVSRAYRAQAYFENGQVWFPAPHLQDEAGGREVWQAALEELLLFPEAEHDDLFDAIEVCLQLAFGSRMEVSLL